MAEEEETSTGSSTLTSFKDHITIELWAKTVKNDISCDAISLLNAFEVERGMNIHFDDRIYSDFVQVNLTLIL